MRVIASEPDVAPPEVAARMNHFLYRSTGPNSYATFFYGRIAEDSRELRYVNAGHNPPMLLRAGSGGIETLTAGGVIVGMFPRAQYEEEVVPLHSGDVLIVYTDGVTEALSPAEEEFGEEKLSAALRRHAALPAAEMAHRILDDLRAWIRDAPLYDDLTFVIMKAN